MRVPSYRLVSTASRRARGPSFTVAGPKVFKSTVSTSPAPSRPAVSHPQVGAGVVRRKSWTSWDRLRERDEWEALDVWEEKIKELETRQAAFDSQVADVRTALAEMDPLYPEAIDRVQELRARIETLSSGARQSSGSVRAETVTIPKTTEVLACHYINGVRHSAGI
ncbi:hypothetical protein VTH06DRAFT_2898 [Thermothelomyces fergusii]